jgi:hypothetical protein
MKRPCLKCGELSAGSYCDECPPVMASATQRGYPGWWQKLSKECRRLQPFCSTCGTVGTQQNPLTLHHTALAWVKVQSGQRLSMRDAFAGLVSVECQRCNNGYGAQRLSRA